jgi:transposase
MSGEDERGLFAELPEAAGPTRPAGGRPRLRRPERGQVELRALSLDELLPADHRARQVWAFAEALELSALYARIKAVEGHAGHPPADPRMLLALWLYAVVEGVGSARELDRLCREHLAFQWLCGGVSVNPKSLSDFRTGHGELLERLLVDGFAALLKAGVARLERVAQDGVRVRAAAGAASFRRLSTLRHCRQAAVEQVGRLRRELEADPGALSRRQAAARRRAADERERRVEQALAAAEALGQARQARATRDGAGRHGGDGGGKDGGKDGGGGEPRASTTDAEARVMKMADGGFRPAYNGQFVADTTSGLIAAVAVDNTGSDQGKLKPMSERLRRDYGRAPAEHLADGGFVQLDDIRDLAKAGVAVYAPVPKPRDPARQCHAARPGDPPEVAAWRQRMGEPAAQQIYKERAATAEWVNAQARNHGLTRFLVRGLDKVKAVLLWHALAHNMMCLWRLTPA